LFYSTVFFHFTEQINDDDDDDDTDKHPEATMKSDSIFLQKSCLQTDTGHTIRAAAATRSNRKNADHVEAYGHQCTSDGTFVHT